MKNTFNDTFSRMSQCMSVTDRQTDRQTQHSHSVFRACMHAMRHSLTTADLSPQLLQNNYIGCRHFRQSNFVNLSSVATRALSARGYVIYNYRKVTCKGRLSSRMQTGELRHKMQPVSKKVSSLLMERQCNQR